MIVIIKNRSFKLWFGLGRTQVRLNANQLNNAISKEIDLKEILMIHQAKELIFKQSQN